MAVNLSALLGNLTMPPADDPLLELERRLEGIRQRTQPIAPPVNPESPGLQSLLAPYESAVTGAPTNFTGTTLDPFAALQQMQSQGQGKGWAPSFSGGSGKIVYKNGIGMSVPAMNSLMRLKALFNVKPLANATGGYRSHAQQKALYQAYLAGNHPALVAKPGTSMHETGNAIDFNTSWITAPAQRDVRRWLLNHGWYSDVPGEPWHYSYGSSG